MNEKENKIMLGRSVGVVMELLQEDKILQAASEFVLGFESYLCRKGVPPQQIVFAAYVNSRKNEQGEREIEKGFKLLPSVDVSATFNGTPEVVQDCLLHVAKKHVESFELLLNLWAAMSDHSSVRSDQFKMAVATVSFIRQWGSHFGKKANPKKPDSSSDLCPFQMLTCDEQVSESMRECRYFNDLLEHMMKSE
tara:strand:- start:179 stop:760 length:582 start_codon:yes stop_codon:yes gene_type:complete